MPEDILARTAPRNAAPAPRRRKRISAVSVILTIVLAFVVILLGERIIFDLNRIANPAIKYTGERMDYQESNRLMYSYESSGVSKTQIYYATEDKSRYITYKILIHSAFIIPIFLLMILFYYIVNIKGEKAHLKVAMWAYVVFAFWMLFHLLGELGRYIIDQYENAAIYIILGLLVVIITPLVIFLQKKFSEHEEQA